MSFLAGRLAGKEGSYFFQETKQAVTRLAQKHHINKHLPSSPSSSSLQNEAAEADMLPEVLRHSLPSKVFGAQPVSDSASSLSPKSKWVLQSDPNSGSSVSKDALNPLRAYVSLPQVTFGPRRWEFPNAQNSISASTANELRRDQHIPISAEKMKAAAEGLTQIGKAFAVATAIIFGGASLLFGLAASKLELHHSDDIRTKGQDLVKPKYEMVREQVMPIRTWAENMSKRWHFEKQTNIKEKPIIRELSKTLGAKTSS